MKKIFLSCCLCAILSVCFAQKETFDLATFIPPNRWKKDVTANAIQFTKEDAATSAYCAITLFKALPATASAKENFDLAWTSVVKQMVTVATEPEMQKPETENGWQTLSGYAPFEGEGSKGVAVLVTASGYQKMMNMIILTNTDVYQAEMTAFLESINLQKPNIQPQEKVIEKAPVQSSGGFTFTTTNFDDGWTSTAKEDWVEVAKENIKVLVHYPNKAADEYNSDLMNGLKKAWDVLVAPRYSSATNMEFKPLYSWESIEFAEADMIENSTGKTLHVVLFNKNFSSGSGRYIEFISPDKNTFEKEFGIYTKEALAENWNKMAAMVNYNKFAVAASDLTGKWTSNFSGMTQYVNAYTGANAGANTHASNESFEFGGGNTYKWDLGVASGFVGNIKFQSAKSSGNFSVPNNWQVNFSDIEGKPKTSNAQFVCIKGARVLWLGENSFGKID